jgi:hypothetical protein
MINIIVVLVIGGVIGALDGVGIFFARDEPFKVEILIAAILKGILVALLTGLSLASSSAWWQGALYGLLYGFVFALVISSPRAASNRRTLRTLCPQAQYLGS